MPSNSSKAEQSSTIDTQESNQSVSSNTTNDPNTNTAPNDDPADQGGNQNGNQNPPTDDGTNPEEGNKTPGDANDDENNGFWTGNKK